jgi:predicted MFS family arabinose efflux permease
MASMTKQERLITPEFLALNAIMFLTYCNIAVFFQFYNYLGTLPINQQSFGLLIALFSVTVLIIRPIISPWLHPGNARRWIAISCASVIVSLLLYNFANDFRTMAAVRLIHGAAYVILATAVLAKLVGCIPRGRSGQAFGLISVITLLPYAVIPPVLEPLNRWAGGFDQTLNLSALLMIPSFPLLCLVGSGSSDAEAAQNGRIGLRGLIRNLKDRRVALLLLLSLVVWTTFTPVFYFLKEYGDKIGATNPGWFFTLSTFTEMAVRLCAGRMFDSLDKSRSLAYSLAWLGLGYIVLANVSAPTVFYGMGLFLGIGWGVAMPLLSGLMFDISEPEFRALNSNLAMEMFQAGFFFGPLLGGVILLHGGYQVLYYACGGILALSVLAAILLGKTKVADAPERQPALD